MSDNANPSSSSSKLENRRLVMCEDKPPERCVNCEKHLPEAVTESMMMINAQGEAIVCGGPVFLCEGCDSAYVHEPHYSAIAARFEFNPYALVGFLDFDRLPEDKRNQPLGEDPDAEIPLVEFTGMQNLQRAKFD